MLAMEVMEGMEVFSEEMVAMEETGQTVVKAAMEGMAAFAEATEEMVAMVAKNEKEFFF